MPTYTLVVLLVVFLGGGAFAQTNGDNNGDNGNNNGTAQVAEPSSLILLLSGLGAVIGLRNRRK